MQRYMDWKKIWLLYRKKIWLIIAIIIFVSAMAGGCYRVIYECTKGEQFYCVSSDYYITFNMKDHPEGVDYYNAYTWDSVLRDDPIIEEVLKNLSKDYTKEEIQASVTGEMLSDYRILTVYSTHTNPKRAQEIADAYEIGLGLFANKLDLFESIELWSQDECVPVVETDLTPNAMFLGMLAGMVIAFLFVAFQYVLDDSIYIEKDFAERFTVPFLGMLTQKGSDFCKQELKDNLSYMLKEKKGYSLVFAPVHTEIQKHKDGEKQQALLSEMKELCGNVDGILSLQGEDLEALRQGNGAILMLPWGSKNGRTIEKMIDFLKKQDCLLAGVIVYNADDVFVRKYYNSKQK